MSKKILVIDDAEFILESTSTLLGFEGYEVITAADGVQGVDAALEHSPDLILCDISMPNLDGYGVVERLRKEEKTNSTPFIFLTAFTEKSNMRKGMELGADDFLVKPYTRDELLATIDTQWKKHKIVEKKIQTKVEEVGKNLNYALPHEFRTVINQVVGSAKFLGANPENTPPEEVKELSADIISSCKRLLRITENFLIYVRIESIANNPKQLAQLRDAHTDEPGAMIYDVAGSIAEKFERYNDLEIGDLPDELFIEISTESFHKIVDELVDNAFKFSDSSTKVVLSAWLEGDMMFMTIEDKGRGMSKDQIDNIGAYIQFERKIYEQQGVGLGLVIAKRMTELHGGKFIVESTENEGTKITLSYHYQNFED